MSIEDRPPSQEQRFSASIDLLKIWRWFKKRKEKDNDKHFADIGCVAKSNQDDNRTNESR